MERDLGSARDIVRETSEWRRGSANDSIENLDMSALSLVQEWWHQDIRNHHRPLAYARRYHLPWPRMFSPKARNKGETRAASGAFVSSGQELPTVMSRIRQLNETNKQLY